LLEHVGTSCHSKKNVEGNGIKFEFICSGHGATRLQSRYIPVSVLLEKVSHVFRPDCFTRKIGTCTFASLALTILEDEDCAKIMI
jgi:hypothetical protein